jgi:hypothetical protein
VAAVNTRTGAAVVMPDDIRCPWCDAKPGQHCRTTYGDNIGLDTPTHTARKQASAEATKLAAQLPKHHKPTVDPMESVVVDGADHPPFRLEGWTVEDVPRSKVKKAKKVDVGAEVRQMSRKLPHHRRSHAYVWCDYHGAIHEARGDVFGDDQLYCHPDQWRRVYIESDDKHEMF